MTHHSTAPEPLGSQIACIAVLLLPVDFTGSRLDVQASRTSSSARWADFQQRLGMPLARALALSWATVSLVLGPAGSAG